MHTRVLAHKECLATRYCHKDCTCKVSFAQVLSTRNVMPQGTADCLVLQEGNAPANMHCKFCCEMMSEPPCLGFLCNLYAKAPVSLAVKLWEWITKVCHSQSPFPRAHQDLDTQVAMKPSSRALPSWEHTDLWQEHDQDAADLPRCTYTGLGAQALIPTEGLTCGVVAQCTAHKEVRRILARKVLHKVLPTRKVFPQGTAHRMVLPM